jgi:hypothetical protein
MADSSRLEFEQQVCKLGKFQSIGDIIGYTDVPLETRKTTLNIMKRTGVIECGSDEFEALYATFINTVFWFDIVPVDMINYYVDRLQDKLKNGLYEVDFVKSSGELRQMVCTMNKDLYINVVKNNSLKHIVADVGLGFNPYINCLEILDVMVASAEKGLTRNFKINKILTISPAKIDEVKENIIDMKVSPIIIEGALKRVITANLKAASETYGIKSATAMMRAVLGRLLWYLVLLR